MKLSRIELSGFKSFADSVTLTFDGGVTAIVGPNGCGKSNVSDAVRWVLGEQSARLLRGGKMEDVIFQGAAGRRPVNVTEVSLYLDNEDGELPIAYQEVVITRRLSRSGQSDYLLNGDGVGYFDALAHLALPILVLSLVTIGLLTRFIRTSVLEVLGSDYVRAARAKGLPAMRVILDYVLRGASLPILTVVGVAFGSLLSGTVLVESVFAWPGLGTYAYNSAANLDLPGIMGVGLVVGLIYLLINFVVDLLYGVLDPRVRIA